MYQITLSKNTEKVEKEKVYRKVIKTITVVTAVTPLHVFFLFFFSERFWKEQFNKFDNRCDVLRAAFCDSRNVCIFIPQVNKNISEKNILNHNKFPKLMKLTFLEP